MKQGITKTTAPALYTYGAGSSAETHPPSQAWPQPPPYTQQF